jgi:eukaryotic-like serine/threonine-protein kinase
MTPPGTLPSRSSDDAVLAEASRLAASFAASWSQGIRIRAEDLLADHPAVRDDPRAAVLVIYEEICQRRERDETVTFEELRSRFPHLSNELAVVLDCDHLLGMDLSPRYPIVGDTLGECRLLAELGRGARGRVYLAEQSFLAGRLLVVKLTPRGGQEYLNLARLQHTHIVPLYDVRDFPDRNLRQLCMPCLGGATLDRLFEELRQGPQPRTGRDVLAALTRATAHPRMSWPTRGPNHRFLERASYVEVVCWIGVCLADALHHAHEQGLVHLDVKPSNALLTSDCVPMLLDFHLARAPLSLDGAACGSAPGGTPGYLSPEQQAAWHTRHEGRPIAMPVDARSDIYSLGLVLREALYGGPPGSTDLPPRADVSPGLRDILARCLHQEASARYASAAQLAEDLRRHLTHRPLVGVPNRSLRERWRKWTRRAPGALIGVACLLTALALAGVYTTQTVGAFDTAREARRQGEREIEAKTPLEALHSFERGMKSLRGVPFADSLRTELEHGARRAAWHGDVDALHQLIERSRYLHHDLAPGTLHGLEVECGAAWQERLRLFAPSEDVRDEEIRERTRRDLTEASVLWSHARGREDGPLAALAVLAEAETLLGPSPVLSRERADLGGPSPVIVPEPRTAWEYYTLGRSLLRAGDMEAAAEAFAAAVELRPQDFWPWFGSGLCAHQRRRLAEAETAFTVCIALAPERAECYHNRARVRADRGDTSGALRDAEEAVRRAPELAEAVLNRGVLYLRQKRYAEAAVDLRRALELGANAETVRYNQGLLR